MDKTISVEKESRFAFGENWAAFLKDLDDESIFFAKTSLAQLLGRSDLTGLTFLDVGSGSGLSSLAAFQMGATVTSFDFDENSVECAQTLRERYGDVDRWNILQGSALDAEYMAELGTFDIVYAWGVLHHTGAMWLGIENTLNRVSIGGQIALGLYNDQGWKSHLWWMIKALYNRLPKPLNRMFGYTLGYFVYALNILRYTIKLQPMKAIRPILNYGKERGMNLNRDLIDWLGGFPFEFVRFDTMNAYLTARGFTKVSTTDQSSLGCHEWVYCRKNSE